MSLNFKFHILKEQELPLLTEWLNKPHLQKWWRAEKVNLNKVREKYLPRIFEEDTAKPFLAFLNEKPIGYIQYYFASKGDPNWWPDNPGNGVIGIDQFIADSDNLDLGFGTTMILQFLRFLKKTIDITEIRVDPAPNNLRAIRCYEKVGFVKKEFIKTPDGPALMMILDKVSIRNL